MKQLKRGALATSVYNFFFLFSSVCLSFYRFISLSSVQLFPFDLQRPCWLQASVNSLTGNCGKVSMTAIFLRNFLRIVLQKYLRFIQSSRCTTREPRFIIVSKSNIEYTNINCQKKYINNNIINIFLKISTIILFWVNT